MRNRQEILRDAEDGEYTGINGGSDPSVGNNTKLIIEVLLDIRELLTIKKE